MQTEALAPLLVLERMFFYGFCGAANSNSLRYTGHQNSFQEDSQAPLHHVDVPDSPKLEDHPLLLLFGER